MAESMVVVVKASRVQEYRQQNVAVLGARAGTSVHIDYAARWVDPALVLRAGDGVLVVFADSPYDEFVPVRFGTVDAVDHQPEGPLAIDVRLGDHVVVDDEDVVQCALRDRACTRPGVQTFVFRTENPGVRAHVGPVGAVEAWRSAVDRLSSNPYFSDSTIVRLESLRDPRGALVGADDEVAVGTDLVVRLELRTPAPGSAAVDVLVDGEPPGGLHAAGPTRAPATGFVHTLRGQRVLDAGGWVRLYEDALLPMAPGDRDLLVDHARHAFELGAWGAVVDSLARVADRTPDDDHRLLIAALRGGHRVDVAGLLHHIDLDHELAFGQLLDAVDVVGQSELAELVAELTDDRLGADKTQRLLLRSFPRFSDVRLAVDCALTVAHHDLEQGAGLLMDRWPDAPTIPRLALDALVEEIQSRLGRLAPYLRRHASLAIAEGRRDAVDRDMALARRLPDAADQIGVLGIVVMNERLGHDTSGQVSQACARAHVSLVFAYLGEESTYRALARSFGTAHPASGTPLGRP